MPTLWLACMILVAPGQEADVLQVNAHGKINWSSRAITANGSGPPSLKAPNATVARLGAERAAKANALSNLTEMVRALPLDGNTTVGSALDGATELKTQVSEVLKNFKTLDTRYFADGGVEIVVEMPLDGGLGELVLSAAGPLPAGGVEAAGPGENSGVVINAKGLNSTPSMGPRLYDDAGHLVYSVSMVAREDLHQRGMAGYSKSLDAALKDARVADKPLILRAQSVKEDTALVLSSSDAAKLTLLHAILAQGRVMIVVD